MSVLVTAHRFTAFEHPADPLSQSRSALFEKLREVSELSGYVSEKVFVAVVGTTGFVGIHLSKPIRRQGLLFFDVRGSLQELEIREPIAQLLAQCHIFFRQAGLAEAWFREAGFWEHMIDVKVMSSRLGQWGRSLS